MLGAIILIHKQNFTGCFFFSFLFQDLISLGLRGQIVPENLRLLLVWYIQAPNCPGYLIDFYELKYLWICHLYVFLLFIFLFPFILCLFFLLRKLLNEHFNIYIVCAFCWWSGNPNLLLEHLNAFCVLMLPQCVVFFLSCNHMSGIGRCQVAVYSLPFHSRYSHQSAGEENSCMRDSF